MSKLTYNKIVAKLERLDEYLGYLKDIQKVHKQVFVTDYHFYGLAERYLQLAIEIILDIGKLIVIAEGFRRPEDNQDIFAVLHERGILSAELAGETIGIANFRNILVHDYEKIDREIVYQKLQRNLDTFTKFKRTIVGYLKKQT